jgi:hypothetical protein
MYQTFFCGRCWISNDDVSDFLLYVILFGCIQAVLDNNLVVVKILLHHGAGIDKGTTLAQNDQTFKTFKILYGGGGGGREGY